MSDTPCHEACTQCGVRELCLPCGLPDAEVARLDRLVYAHLKVSRGDDLCRAGDPFGALYAIRSGFFKSERVLEDGRGQIMGFHMSGEMVGMEGIGAERYACNVVALQDSDVCVIPLRRLEESARELRGMQHMFQQIVGREIGRAHGAMLLLGGMRAE